MNTEATYQNQSLFVHPIVGSALAALSGISFLFLCMLLSLVGRQGSAVDWAAANSKSFLLVLCMTLLFAILSFLSKSLRRSADHSPFPLASAALIGLCLFIGLAHFTGLLRI